MSMFDALFTNVCKTDTGVEFSFEDIRFHLTDSKLDLDYEISAMENYFSALDRLSEVCASIESCGDKLDDSVKEFINYNGEISTALGIALEDDQTTNAKEVKEKSDKNIFQKAWDAIKRFFTAIWNKIVGFFKWIGNGFKKLPEKVSAAEKAFNQLTPEEKAKFLAEAKANVTPKDINERLLGLVDILELIGNIASGSVYDVMNKYYTAPGQLYPPKLAKALAKYNIRIINEAGKNAEDILGSGDPAFVNQVFKMQVTKSENKKEAKPLKDMGWNESSVQELFISSNKASNIASNIEQVVGKLEQEANSMNSKQMEEQFNKLYAAKSNFLYRLFVNWEAKKNMQQAGAEAYRKGLNSICNMYKACLYAIKEVWVDDNRILDLFRKSPAELNKEAESK